MTRENAILDASDDGDTVDGDKCGDVFGFGAALSGDHIGRLEDASCVTRLLRILRRDLNENYSHDIDMTIAVGPMRIVTECGFGPWSSCC